MAQRNRKVNVIGLIAFVVFLGGVLLYLTQCEGMSLQEIGQDGFDRSPGGVKSPGRRLLDEHIGD